MNRLQGQRGQYLDAKKFTALFRRPGENRQAIAVGIHLIAQNLVRRYHWVDLAWREDAAAEATLLGLRKIEHYRKNCRQANAFLYFTKLVQMKVWERLKMERRIAQGKSPWGKE